MRNNIISAMLASDPAEREKALNRETLRHAVSRKMFCDGTKVVLDVRTAVMVTVTMPDGKTGMSVYTGDAYDRVADQFRTVCERVGATVEIIDGRTL